MDAQSPNEAEALHSLLKAVKVANGLLDSAWRCEDPNLVALYRDNAWTLELTARHLLHECALSPLHALRAQEALKALQQRTRAQALSG
ncbi:MAG: hypothetical protein ABW136_03335 [Steroidobacteraceae bacterium]